MENIDNILQPQILAAEKDYLVVYKPPKMHSAPQAKSEGVNILYWCAGQFPEIMDLKGRRAGEGGLLHRLDYETQGLMLIARTRIGMDAFLKQQNEGVLAKEYCALASRSEATPPGFPLIRPDPEIIPKIIPKIVIEGPQDESGFRISSAFRPYGPGRKEVRPVILSLLKSGDKVLKPKGLALDRGNEYTTDVLRMRDLPKGIKLFRLRIFTGFRHQLRSHLTWMGMPILNDSLYGGLSCGNGFLALRAFKLAFIEPGSGRKIVCSIHEWENLEAFENSS